MQYISKYGPALMSSLLLCVVVGILYPYCSYYIDPDGTAYLTIVERYATGHVHEAINGYWSPWSCWLAALLVKTGVGVIASSIIVNAAGAVSVIYVTQLFYTKYRVAQYMQWLLGITLALFLSYAVYKQTFDDLWECFFLLYALRIMVSGSFKYKPVLWVCVGLLGALAYFAKAYALPFFILNTLCCVFFITRAWTAKHIRQWLLISAVIIGVMMMCSSPWIYALHGKYGVWTTSTAGPLNTSWYLVGHPYWKEHLQALLPPPYSHSPTYWEDPWMANGATPHFYSSAKLLALQVARIGLNILKFVQAINELSAFFAFVWLMALGLVLSRKMRCFFSSNKVFLPALSFLLFPIGFFLVNFESRYIWYMLPLSMLLGCIIIQKMQRILAVPSLYSRLIPLVFALSFLLWPVWDMRNIWNGGKQEALLAAQLKHAGIEGKLSANFIAGDDGYAEVQRLAYLNNSNLYLMMGSHVTAQQLNAELKQYGVAYFMLYRTGTANIRQEELRDGKGQYPIVFENEQVKVLKINN